MVDKPGQVPTFSSIDDGVLINTEQIAASNALLLVSLLPHVSNDLRRKKQYTPMRERVLFITITSLTLLESTRNNKRVPVGDWQHRQKQQWENQLA